MHKSFLVLAALSGAVSVGLGAFGAHGLKKILPAEAILTFETGVRYQFYHSFALMAVAMLFDKIPAKFLFWSGTCFITGIVLFSGSLYALAFIQDTGAVGLRKLGIVTPFGGLFFIAGWLLLALAAWKNSG